MWRRAAWAVLCCLLVLGMYSKIYFQSRAFGVVGLSWIQRISHDPVDLSAELGHALRRVGKYVAISDGPPYVEKLLAPLHQKQVVIQNVNIACSDRLVSTDQSDAVLGKSKLSGSGSSLTDQLTLTLASTVWVFPPFSTMGVMS